MLVHNLQQLAICILWATSSVGIMWDRATKLGTEYGPEEWGPILTTARGSLSCIKSCILAAADRKHVFPPQLNPELCSLQPFQNLGTVPMDLRAWIYLQNTATKHWATAMALLLWKSLMAPKTRCLCLSDTALCSFSTESCKESEQGKIGFL